MYPVPLIYHPPIADLAVSALQSSTCLTQRHKQARLRQHGEICDQLWSRLEVIAVNHARVEFFREIAAILASEAKDLLKGSLHIAGE